MRGAGWVSRAFVVTCAVAGSGCGGAPPPSGRPVTGDPCVIAEQPLAGDPLVFALPGAVDPANAPVPTTLAERIVFRALYETLIRIDCRGRILPGLAVSWRSEDGGRRWVFEIRPNATFVDGFPVTARAVMASWRANESRRPRPWADSVVTSVSVRGDRSLAVSLDRPHTGVPRVFADPGLAVARPAPSGDVWALGSGAFTVATASEDRVLAVPRQKDAAGGLPEISFRAAGDDPRDLVDAGATLVMTTDPAVSAYATAVGGVRVVALPWDRVYVLAVPSASIDTMGQPVRTLPENLTAAAAGADARVPVSPYWWQDASACLEQGQRVRSDDDKLLVPRILYRRDDRTARGLAERLVALSGSAWVRELLPAGIDPMQVAAAGLAQPAYDVVLREGGIAAYVVALERAVLDTCAAAAALADRVAWPARLIPLVETRPHLVIQRLSGTMALDWDGAPYLTVTTPVP